MAYERRLTLAEQQKMIDWIAPAVECASERRLQSILKQESSLVRDTSSRGLKKLITKPKLVATTLVERLQERATQHRTCVALQRIIRAAWKSPTLNDRVRNRFYESSAAVKTGNWERVRRLAERLEALHCDDTTDHSLLRHHQQLILLESGSPERVFSALDYRPHMESPAEPTPEVQGRPPKQTTNTTPPPQPALGEAPTTSPDKQLASGRAPETPPSSNHKGIETWIGRAFSELRSLEQRAFALDPTVAEFAEVIEACSDAASLDMAPEAPATALQDALSTLLEVVETQLSNLEQRLEENAAARLRAEEELRKLIGDQDLDELEKRWTEARVLFAQLPTERVEQLEKDLAEDSQIGGVLERIEGEHATWQEEQERSKEADAALEVLARIQGISIEEIRRRLAVQGTTKPDKPVIQPPPPPPSNGLAFQGRCPYPKRFPSSRLLSVEGQSGSPQPVFLPMAPEAGLHGAGAPSNLRVTAAAAFLVAVAHRYTVDSKAAPSTLLDLIADAEALAGTRFGTTPKVEGTALVETVLSLLLISATPLRYSGAGKRLVRQLVGSTTADHVAETTTEIARRVAGFPGTPGVLAGALQAGLSNLLIEVLLRVQAQSVLKGRQLGSDFGVAASSIADDEPFRSRAYEREGLDSDTTDQVEVWLEGFQARGRRPQPPLSVELSPWLTGFLTQRASCFYQTETQGQANLNVSVPQQVQNHGIFAEEGEERVVLPILVRNSGKAAAAGIEVSIVKVEGAVIESRDSIRHVAWLARVDLEAPQDAIVEVPVTLNEGQRDRLVLRCELHFSSGEITKPKALTYKVSSTIPVVDTKGIPGLSGKPMDLLDDGVLQRSARTVREVYLDLRDNLREGTPIRRLVYGRRRRGKSSIRSTLKRDPLIRKQFFIATSEWNAARMTSVESAFHELGETIVRALHLGDIKVRPFEPQGLTDREGLYRAWKAWLREASGRVPKPVKVLLLIDEFQKWLAALGDVADRQTVLNAFRDFNDDTVGDGLTVAFVLFGLRSLKRLTKASNDFGNAVKADEIKALTIEEASRYIRETLPVDHDGRTRQRLARLSGGNPFVLNLLSAELTSRVVRNQRPYALVTDVSALLEEMSSLDSRLDRFFDYMLKEDEDESAVALPQLTVLRAVASILEETGDYSSFLRVEAIEEWLQRKKVSYERGLPAEQLSELADVGVLDRHSDGMRYNLPGEAICRWLASRSEDTAPLRPVSRLPSVEMVLNRYEIVRALEKGGQNARIYLARDTTLTGRQVVLKIYEGSELHMRRKVEREARLLERAQGRYVVPLHEYGFDERKGGVLVMKWIEGHTLSALLAGDFPSAQPLLPGGEPDRQVQLMKKLAEGVSCLHRAGVLHKDLSARNVMLLNEAGVWEPRLIDFGISGEVCADDDSVPDQTTMIGTARYMAPEKQKFGRARSKPSDIFSLGVLFIDLTAPRLPGRLPKDELEEASEAIHPSLRALISEMLSENPEDRPTAEVVQARLEGVLDPIEWTQLRETAVERFCEGDLTESLQLFHRAVVETPVSEVGGEDFGGLLEETLDCLQSVTSNMDWWESLFSAIFEHCLRSDQPFSWDALLDALRASQDGTSEGVRVYEPLLARLENTKPEVAFVGLIGELCDLATIVDRYADRFHYLLVTYGLADLSPAREAVDFCAAQAKRARLHGRPLTECELWLRRGRRILAAGTDTLKAEWQEYDAAREQTHTLQTLPSDSDSFEVILGANEGGHDKAPKIKAFAEKIRRGHPYVAAVRRLRKAPKTPVPVPTLLGLDSASADLEGRGIERDRVIPFLLDSSYTRSQPGRDAVSLRMAIVLSEGTTAAQRQAAYDRLKDDEVLFPQ